MNFWPAQKNFLGGGGQIISQQGSSVNVSDKLGFKLGFKANRNGAMIDS